MIILILILLKNLVNKSTGYIKNRYLLQEGPGVLLYLMTVVFMRYLEFTFIENLIEQVQATPQ